jgi:hypothetical protein
MEKAFLDLVNSLLCCDRGLDYEQYKALLTFAARLKVSPKLLNDLINKPNAVDNAFYLEEEL